MKIEGHDFGKGYTCELCGEGRLLIGKGTSKSPVILCSLCDRSDPFAAWLGAEGGVRGGKARAAALSPERRREISRHAANARWGKTKETSA